MKVLVLTVIASFGAVFFALIGAQLHSKIEAGQQLLRGLIERPHGLHNGAYRLPWDDAGHEHPRFGALAETPASGIRAVRHDGTLTVGGTRPTPAVRTHRDNCPWLTQALPVLPVDYEPETAPEFAFFTETPVVPGFIRHYERTGDYPYPEVSA